MSELQCYLKIIQKTCAHWYSKQFHQFKVAR